MTNVSIVICTNGRHKSLEDTLKSLSHLNYKDFEVCVVCGPTQDGTHELVKSFGKIIKTAFCLERNLSMSRNIGLELASGEIVAFIDDDAIPEPSWLNEVLEPFKNADVGAAGGLVYDNSGFTPQHLYVTCDRLGRAKLNRTEPADDLNYPFSFEYPHVTGTNSVFRREALVDIGGFDEEFDYYLDETDVCCRLIDAGWRIVQLSNARMHHKFLPSSIRNSARVTNPYPLIKNKVYFSLKHAANYKATYEIMEDCAIFAKGRRAEHEEHVKRGNIREHELENFDLNAEAAWRVGLFRGGSGIWRNSPSERFDVRYDFVAFPTLQVTGQRRVIVFLSQSFPPRSPTGVARYTHDISRALAALGHEIHVFTIGENANTVDFEEGVWVHRLTPIVADATGLAKILPPSIRYITRAYATELNRLCNQTHVDIVEASSWDLEGLEVLIDKRVPLVVNIVTTLAHFLDTHPELATNISWMKEFGEPVQSLEKNLFQESDGVIAASRAIAESVQERYQLKLDESRLAYVPHLASDISVRPKRKPSLIEFEDDQDRVSVLFVGRLEARKGADILLDVVKQVSPKNKNVQFWLAGDTSYKYPDGKTAKDAFIEIANQQEIESTVFLGIVSDEELRWLYESASIIIVPSRFESYGLVAQEAMMFGKPVIAANVGGLAELVKHRITGVLVESEDVDGFSQSILALSQDKQIGKRFGKNAKDLFDLRYSPVTLARKRLDALSRFMREEIQPFYFRFYGHVNNIILPNSALSYSLQPNSSAGFETASKKIWLEFWTHPWSGVSHVFLDDKLIKEVDLFSEDGKPIVVEIYVPGKGVVSFKPAGTKHPDSSGIEVHFIRAWQHAMSSDIKGE